MTQEDPTATSAERLAIRVCLPADEDVFKLIVENAVDVIVRGDAARNRIYVSPSSRDMLGFEPAEMLGKHAYELVHPEDLSRTQAVFAKIGPQYPSQDLTFRMRCADGRYIWVGGRYRYLPADGGVLAVLRDITAQKQAEHQLAEANAALEEANTVLRRLAQVDSLTGLANRRHFDVLLDDELHRARRSAAPLGLVMLDVDYFKAYNDRYGHLGGDDCLRCVSRCVNASLLRPSDHAARFGGEEIVVLLPATDVDGSAAVAERIRKAVANLSIQHTASALGIVTVSAGAASGHQLDADSQAVDLIKAADVALYRAKAGGRNCVRYHLDSLASATGA